MKKGLIALLASLVVTSAAFGGEEIQLASKLTAEDSNMKVASSIEPTAATSNVAAVASVSPVANMVSYGLIIASGLTIVANGGDSNTTASVSH